jgi:hypothetical protein
MIFMFEILQIEKCNLFQNLFVTQNNRNPVIFPDRAYFQSHTIVGEPVSIGCAYNQKHGNPVCYIFYSFCTYWFSYEIRNKK